MGRSTSDLPQLGLFENRVQFTLLVVVNAFVGGMVGLERAILPELAETEFGIAATSAVLSFIVVFGIVKALSNFYAGKWAERFGRKPVLLAGWLFAIPVPVIIIYAPTWEWVVAANVLLGINQGLAWSTTVIMKIDLVGDRQRGLAMGLNEFAGYLAVALTALGTGYIAANYGVRPAPFLMGIGFAFVGLLLTLFFVKETRRHTVLEAGTSAVTRLQNAFHDTTWRNATLGAVTQAGLVNNLNDGMIWGLLPVLMATKGFALEAIGIAAGIYPAVWGVGQLITGAMADRMSKKLLLVTGMFLQGVTLLFYAVATEFWHFASLSALLGWGTAMVYPTFLATIAEHTHPFDRAKSLGAFRLWRDLGYAAGALLTGLIADRFGLDRPIQVIAILTLMSGFFLWVRMKEMRQ